MMLTQSGPQRSTNLPGHDLDGVRLNGAGGKGARAKGKLAPCDALLTSPSVTLLTHTPPPLQMCLQTCLGASGPQDSARPIRTMQVEPTLSPDLPLGMTCYFARKGDIPGTGTEKSRCNLNSATRRGSIDKNEPPCLLN